MKIQDKESFVTLFILALNLNGARISTFYFPVDILAMSINSKYNDLFSFCLSENDFIFDKQLLLFKSKGYIDYRENEDLSVTIILKNTLPLRDKVKKSSLDCLGKMSLLIEEIFASKSLTEELCFNTRAFFRKENPNGIHSISKDMLIITDGYISTREYLSVGSYMVEEAHFIYSQHIFQEKIFDVNVLYPFKYERYLYNILKKIITFLRRKEPFPESLESEFEELSVVNGYRYKGF